MDQTLGLAVFVGTTHTSYCFIHQLMLPTRCHFQPPPHDQHFSHRRALYPGDGGDSLSFMAEINSKTLAVLVTIAFSVVGVLRDYSLKLARKEDASLKTPSFYIGLSLYAATAFGWVFVMKHLK